MHTNLRRLLLKFTSNGQTPMFHSILHLVPDAWSSAVFHCTFMLNIVILRVRHHKGVLPVW